MSAITSPPGGQQKTQSAGQFGRLPNNPPAVKQDVPVTRQIVAFFASSFLCVSLTIPVCAEEKTGVVADVDRDRALLTFDDGSSYALPSGFDFDAVAPGMEAHVILDRGA